MTTPAAATLPPPLMDAVAALRCWAYETTFDRVHDDHGAPVVFRIEPLPAADWLIATLQHGHLSYLPGLLDDVQRDRLMEALADGDLTVTELQEANRDALEEMSGWRWWQASRLIAVLGQRWEVTGTLLTSNGVNPATHSLGAVCAALYGALWHNTTKPEDRAKLTQAIVAPPEQVLTGPDGTFNEEAAEAAVWAFIQAGPTGLRGD